MATENLKTAHAMMPSSPTAGEPPPSYNASAFSADAAAADTIAPLSRSDRRMTFREMPTGDPYAALRGFDTVFLIDDSGSMAGANWRQTADALAAVVPVCTAYDADGVDIHFLNATFVEALHAGVASAQQVMDIFSRVRPMGATPTGRRLEILLKRYLAAFREAKNRGSSVKPLNVICITDGEPTDPDKLERAIISAAQELDRLGAPLEQIGIQFFQVGSDEAATEALEELDNALSEEVGVRDIVDTVSWRKMNQGEGLTGDGILKVVLGGVDRRLDRKRRL